MLLRWGLLSLLLETAYASSFYATTRVASDEAVNQYLSRRGPHGRRCARHKGITMCHNLLQTGERMPQPFLDASRGVMLAYDGEIYNFLDIAREVGAGSPGDLLLALYRRHGPHFVRKLDGDFALMVVDTEKGVAVLATDVFGSKPLWYERYEGKGKGFSVASYRSSILALGASEAWQVDPNSVLSFKLEDPAIEVQRFSVHEFDLRQFKADAVDYLSALEQAVRKRMPRGPGGPPLMGLSPGFDSGALQVMLKLSGRPHVSYTMVCTDDVTQIENRIAWTGDLVEGNLILPSEEDLLREIEFLREHCENFNYTLLQGSVAEDPSSPGYSQIFGEAQARGLSVFLSALGADEVLGSELRAPRFPEDLHGLFPWASFFLGTQRDHLMKEELIAGSHGIEGRYPFLDKRVVQEYLWLTASAKNSQYKAPLQQLFQAVQYPFIVHKVGFNGAYRMKLSGQSLKFRQGNLELINQSHSQEMERREADVLAAQLEVAEVQNHLMKREEELHDEAVRSDVEQMQRIQMTLFTMVPRFAEMLHAATPVERQESTFPVHAKWHSVEIVTCVTGGHDVVVADFPMYQLFKVTTPLEVLHNVCQDVKWEGIDFRLRKYQEFFEELAMDKKDQLYMVVDGLDVFFNDVTEVAGQEAESRATATARVIAERYEALARGRRVVVMSTERLCGWGGAKFCSPEDEAKYPEAPTDSKYLNAGGYIGPAEALREMITAVAKLKRTATGVHQERGQMSDQYFFKLYFWEHQDRVILDYHQTIFGNFLEISNRPCESDWAPTCAVKPCCTESDNFRRFHHHFFRHYKVKGCAVWRQENLPISWHGNGAGKWLYLLALNQLSLRCGPAANVTRARMPEKMMAELFVKYETRSQAAGSNWPGGFLTSTNVGNLIEESGAVPAECRT